MKNQIIELTNLGSVYQTGRHTGKTSEKYGFVSTAELVELVKAEGLYPVRAKQASVNIAENNGYQKHSVTFRYERDIARLYEVGEEIPEMTVVNSHMASSSIQFWSGMTRCVCDNQLTIKSAAISEVRINHSQFASQKVGEGVAAILAMLPAVGQQVAKFKAIELSPEEQVLFAESAAILRFDTEKQIVNPSALLNRRRYADKAPTLWNTFNAVQENIIKGGVRMQSNETGKRRRAKGVTSLAEDIRLNSALWQLTEKMAELRA